MRELIAQPPERGARGAVRSGRAKRAAPWLNTAPRPGNLTGRRLPPYAPLVMRARALGALAFGLFVWARAGVATADDNDLSLSRFVKPLPPDAAGHVPLGAAAPDAAAQTRFRALASELGVVLAPKLLAPA